MKKIPLQDLENGKLIKGSMILIRWLDASNKKAHLKEHETSPEIHCKDWGIYLGISGRSKKMLLLGKDLVEMFNEWGASRIPLDLIVELYLILTREQVLNFLAEVSVLGRRVNLRKTRPREGLIRVQVY